jgi:hypothetical protein
MSSLTEIKTINEIGQYRDTKALWAVMTGDQKRIAVEGLNGTEDHKTLLRRLRRVTNKARHDAQEKRKQQTNRRIQEILIARPVDRTLIELRAALEHVTDEPNPLTRYRQLKQYIARYDARIAELTAINKARRAQTVAA